MVAEKLGRAELSVDRCKDTEAQIEALLGQFPELKSVKFSLAINKKLVSSKQEIPEHAELALLPPFSGG